MLRSAGSPPSPPLLLLVLVLILLVVLVSPSCGLVTGHRFRSAQLSSHQQLASAVLSTRAMCGALCLRRPPCSGVQFTAAQRDCRLYETVVGGGGVSPPPEGLALDQELTTTEPTTGPSSSDQPATTTSSFQCTMPNWEVGYGGHCYFFSSDKTSPNVADERCRNIHPSARITSVTNADERAYIVSKIVDKIVVGLVRSSPSLDDWHWENGDASTDFRGFYEDGEPKNDDDQRMFTLMLTSGGLMSAAAGDDTFFVCKINGF